MEDISRELEREIAKAKPAPYKVKKDEKILIVDDFGGMRPGGYLKTLARFFFIVGVIGLVGSAVLYYLFTDTRKENIRLKARLAQVESKTVRLTGEKEILMARLVMAGKDVTLDSSALPLPDEATVTEKKETVDDAVSASKDKQAGILSKHRTMETVSVDRQDSPAKSDDAETDNGAVTAPISVDSDAQAKVVSVEKFSVSRGKNNGQLIVRFNIRNISKESKEISGRIFAVMKQADAPPAEWVVVPGGKMADGMPGPYRKGQYFSITRFKPVMFTVKSKAAPESFKTAAIYIFGDDQKLLFDNTITINGGQ